MLLPPDATILDLGCGSGWLAAMLSAEPKVAHVIAWDSSPHLLEQVLPEMVELVGGDIARIERVCGDFVPLMLGDTSQDLRGHELGVPPCRRPRRPSSASCDACCGPTVRSCLNETPWKRLMVLGFATRMYLAAPAARARHAGRAPGAPRRRSRPLRRPARGPGLHGRSVAALAREQGFTLEVRDSGMPSFKAAYRERVARPNLAHIVLRLR